MKILSLYNLKGGVGKTTAAVNLGHLAAGDGFRVLLCDLDPQAASTFYLREEAGGRMKTGKFLKGKSFARDRITPTEFISLDLLPAHLDFRSLDQALGEEKKSKSALHRLFHGFRGEYDLLVVDAPAGINLLAENLFRLSHLVLVPTIPTTLSVNCLAQVEEFFGEHDLPAKRLFGFFSLADRRKRLHRETMDGMRGEVRHRFLETVIPSSSVIERMGEHRRPVGAFAARSPGAGFFADLWEETRERLGLDEGGEEPPV